MKDIADNPHYRERHSVLDIVDPATGTPLKIPNVPFRLDATRGAFVSRGCRWARPTL